VRIKEIIKYDQYKKFASESTIKYGDVNSDTTNAKPANPPATSQNPPK
jgi:hypothetical protein